MRRPKIIEHVRPLNGWRAFVGEVGVIILGVLIALALGQFATMLSWRADAADARQAIAIELGEALGQATERTGYAPCVYARLDALAKLIDQAAQDQRLPPLGDIGSPPIRPYHVGIWESIESAQTTAHFNRDELNAYVSAYEHLRNLHDSNKQELAAWTRLYALVGPGRTLGDVEAIDLRRAVSDARVASRKMVLDSVRLQQILKVYQLPYDQAAMREFADRPVSKKEICQPIDSAIPATYGQSPFRATLDRVRNSPVKRLGHS